MLRPTFLRLILVARLIGETSTTAWRCFAAGRPDKVIPNTPFVRRESDDRTNSR